MSPMMHTTMYWICESTEGKMASLGTMEYIQQSEKTVVKVDG